MRDQGGARRPRQALPTRPRPPGKLRPARPPTSPGASCRCKDSQRWGGRDVESVGRPPARVGAPCSVWWSATLPDPLTPRGGGGQPVSCEADLNPAWALGVPQISGSGGLVLWGACGGGWGTGLTGRRCSPPGAPGPTPSIARCLPVALVRATRPGSFAISMALVVVPRLCWGEGAVSRGGHSSARADTRRGARKAWTPAAKEPRKMARGRGLSLRRRCQPSTGPIAPASSPDLQPRPGDSPALHLETLFPEGTETGSAAGSVSS